MAEEESKMIMPPMPPPCDPMYPSDKDIAIDLLKTAISILERKTVKYPPLPTIMAKGEESKEED